MKRQFEEKQNWNGATAVFYKGLFIGQYSNAFKHEFQQFSGNKNQIFSKNLAVQYLKQKTNGQIIVEVKRCGENQMFLKASAKLIN